MYNLTLFMMSTSLLALPLVVMPVNSARAQSVDSGTMERADADMRDVLMKFIELGPKPLETLTPQEARKQPTPADAVAAVLKA